MTRLLHYENQGYIWLTYIPCVMLTESQNSLNFFGVVLSKFEAFFMDQHFNLRRWKKSTFLPALSISLLLIIGLLIFLSSIFNRIYLKKKAYKKNKAKFTITVSFKTLYTIFGVVFLLCGIIQSLIFLKGEREEY